MESCLDNFVTDQHEHNQWGMVKFTLERDNSFPLFMTVDQISERFMEPDYVPPPTKIILTRLKTQIDPKTQQVSFVQSYTGGEQRVGESHITSTFMEGLDKGIYLAFYQADFRKEFAERKLVFSIYCDQAINNLQRINFEDYPKDAINFFKETLIKNKGHLNMTQDEDEYGDEDYYDEDY